jgi:ribose transport system permease protein
MNITQPVTQIKSSSPPLRRRLKFFLRSFDAGLLITLVLMGIFFSTQSPYFLSVENFMNIGRAVSIRGVVAAGLTLVMISGGIDLSVASAMAASGMLTATLVQAGFHPMLAITGSLVLGALLGAFNGTLITKVRIAPIIATLATMSAIRGLGYVFSGGESISLPPGSFRYLGRGEILGIPAPLVWWALVCALVYFTLRFTRLGHYTYAIGGSADACRVSGIKINRYRMWLYVICGILAALGGVMLASLSGSAMPTAAFGAELDILTAIILGGISLSGGAGGITGTILGLLIIGTMTNGMILMNVKPYWQIVLRGVVLTLAVTVDSLRTGGYR